MQNYSVFQLGFKHFKTSSAKSNKITARKSNGLSEENIESPTTSSNSLAWPILQ